jgi:hypothetical protein
MPIQHIISPGSDIMEQYLGDLGIAIIIILILLYMLWTKIFREE